jgi:hypothetical protein
MEEAQDEFSDITENMERSRYSYLNVVGLSLRNRGRFDWKILKIVL